VSVELPIRIKRTPLLFNKDSDGKAYKDLFPSIDLTCPIPIHLASKKKSTQLYPNFVNENTLK